MLGQIVSAKRRSLGWSKLELARRSGLSDSHIGQIERGEYQVPTEPTLKKLSKALGVDLKLFLPTEESHLGENVKYYRHLRNLSQRELETLSGLSKGHVSKIERKVRKEVEKETLGKIATALGIQEQMLCETRSA